MPLDPSNEDTIAAISTPIGQAGIGIVRLSGPKAKQIAQKLFRSKSHRKTLQSHKLYLGHLVDPPSGSIVDEVLLSYMAGPNTYTREDIVEINSHSGYLLLSRILQLVLAQGARLADPGEFTFRAYLNGRIDLTQAEAVIDLINSQSDRGIELASQQVKGDFRRQVEDLRQKIMDILAHLEVAIDFPEEDESIFPRRETAEKIENELIEPVKRIIEAHSQRKIWVDGINTVIVGRVNVGKSSLLNRLLDEERAIVTPIPGTTRDIIESTIHIAGIPLRIMDTAGFRKVKGEVERIGIRLTKEKLEGADLALAMIDGNRSLNQDDLDILAKVRKGHSLVLVNKIDLPLKINEKELNELVDGLKTVKISALTGEGIDDLRDAIRDLVLSGEQELESTQVVPNLRHKTALNDADQLLAKAAFNTKAGLPLDIIAVDLNGSLGALGEIIGETTNEDVLDRIFSNFCLGK